MTEICFRMYLNWACSVCKSTVLEATFITRLVLRYAGLGTRKLNILHLIIYILNAEFECYLQKVNSQVI